VSPRRDERGVALILSLIVLLILSALVLSLLSVSALEPRIARNLGDGARARWLAEGGIELAYAALVATAADGGWSGLLATATPMEPWVVLAGLDRAPLPGLTPAAGTCTVSIRSDDQAGAIGGVIVRAACTRGAAARTIEVVVGPAGAGPPALPTMSNWREP
jgi:Tfp pilus assembly protein PilX